MRLMHKVALVTGAQQGIGAAVAVRLAEEGASVAINYLDDEPGAGAVARRVEAAGGRAVVIQADVSRAADVQRLLAAAEAALGGVDILVNNAGVFPRANFLDVSEELWDHVLGVNLKGTFLCSQQVARRLIARGSPGAIISLSSSSPFRGSARAAHYMASKAGIIGLTRGMALELAPHKIRVNAVAPGLTDTAQPRDGAGEEEIQAMAALVPLGWMAEPRDVADAVLFLASEESRHITGQVIHVNGGQYFG